MKIKNPVIFLIPFSVCVLASLLWVAGVFQGTENLSLDARFRIRGEIGIHKDVVIVAFDEASFSRLGKWPWERKLHGRVVRNLAESGAKAIVFDMLLIEPDLKNPNSDNELFKACKESGKTVFASFYNYDADANPVDFILPLGPLIECAKVGFSNMFPEIDGVCRKAPIFKIYEGKFVPSLALAGIWEFLGMEPLEIVKERKVKTDRYGEIIINFAGGYGTFPYFSFVDVLNSNYPKDIFRNKIVLIGGTAAGLFDSKPTPFAPNFPGIEIHANVISNLLNGNYIRPVPWYLNFFLLVFSPFLASFLFYKASPLKSGVVGVLVVVAYSIAVYWLFASKFIYVEYAAPLASFLGGYAVSFFYRFVVEEKEKRWIKKSFSHYLSATVMENILSNPEALKLGGERKNLSVLFSDIRGFTTISESLSPEEVVEFLNEYLSKMVEVVFKYDGTLDKFIGDAVMAFWGAPVSQDDHAKKAVFCAIDMMKELKILQDSWRAKGKTAIDIGIGINSGEMIVGNMGSTDKMEYTVIGDNVNLASRLEGLNKEFKTNIIISERTYLSVKDEIEAKPLGSVNVKGKTQAVDVYQVLGRKA